VSFWELTHSLRRTALAARAEAGPANVVFTNCCSSPEDDGTLAALERVITSRGGVFLSVFLECGVQTLRHRVVRPGREEMHKLHTVDGLDGYLASWNFVALDRPHTLRIPTEDRTPEVCAAEIASQLL